MSNRTIKQTGNDSSIADNVKTPVVTIITILINRARMKLVGKSSKFTLNIILYMFHGRDPISGVLCLVRR